MVKDDYTHISFVLDRSGSMGSIREDTIGGFNTFLKQQREIPGKVTVSMVQFDTEYEVLYNGVELDEVKDLDDKTFVPRGMTALLDASARMINETGDFLSAMNEEDQPGKVLFVIITDGHENSSQEFSLDRVKEMVTHQTDTYSWEFVFLGANIDAVTVAGGFGIAASNAIKYGHNSGGTQAVYDSLSCNVGKLRKGLTKDASFTTDDREAQEEYLSDSTDSKIKLEPDEESSA